MYQPPAHDVPPHWIAVTGAVASGVTVKEVAVELRPALFVAVTFKGSDGSTAVAPKV